MQPHQERRLRFYLSRPYPVHVIACAAGFVVELPDLPDVRVEGRALRPLYAQIELRKQAWLRARVAADAPVPAPNSSAARARLERPTQKI